MRKDALVAELCKVRAERDELKEAEVTVFCFLLFNISGCRL